MSGYSLFLVLVAGSIYLYNPLPENPVASELATNIDKYQVEIVRDKWGVPHIKGATDADTSFGLAYAHAEDDFETIQEIVAATRGVLAAYRGQTAAPTDYIVALMDVWGTIERDYANKVPNDVKAIASAYADGMNLYASRHPDQTWRGLAPFTAEDVIAGFVFKTPFFYGFDKVLLDAFDENRKSEIALSPTGSARSWQVSQRQGAELGSNAMAISPQRSADGRTRLLINSHQPMVGPVAWYEAHLISDQGLNITGGIFPGTPVILHGFNKDIGWANTVNHVDFADTYVLTRNPEDPNQYMLDGQWVEFEEREVTLSVKLWGPFRFPAKRKVLYSKHGPVVESGDKTYAVRYAGMGEIRQLEQYKRLNKAKGMSDFMQIMSMNALPSINYVVADKEGQIAFIHNGQYPNRNDAWDWSGDLPGDDSSLIWQGYRPYTQVPKLLNPKSGLIFNANNTPYVATDGDDNLRKEDFPQSMGLADNHTNRSLRLVEMNDGRTRLNKADILAQKFDLKYSKESDYIKLIDKVLALDISDDQHLSKAQAHIKSWDRYTNVENPHAALAVTFMRRVKRSDTPNDHSEQRLLAELKWSVDYLSKHFGGYEIEWGKVNRLVRGSVDLPVDGGPDILRAIYSIGQGEDETPYATHGDTWMALVEWDNSGEQTAQLMHQFGSATLDEKSPHYNDQAPLFAAKKWRVAVLDYEKVKKSAAKVYQPNKEAPK